MLKAHNYAEEELCHKCFSRNFLKIFRTVILREDLLMDIPYFNKEDLWISAFDEASLKTFFDKSKPSSKLTLKTKCYHSCGCCDDSPKHFIDKYLEKKDSEP